jgi:hypothetical protein
MKNEPGGIGHPTPGGQTIFGIKLSEFCKELSAYGG